MVLKETELFRRKQNEMFMNIYESVTITPRNYTFALKNGEIFKNTYALIGMATVYNEYPLYAEAINEYNDGPDDTAYGMVNDIRNRLVRA